MKIAVFWPNWVGDAVMATPAVRALRAHFRDAHFIATSSGLVAMQNHSIGGPSQSAAFSGPASVRFFGTISPMTVWKKTTMPRPITMATGCTAPSGRPSAWIGAWSQ